MKSFRAGEALWSEWTGKPSSKDEDVVVFFTEGAVSLDTLVVKQGLASALQRDGIVDSLGGCFRLIDNLTTSTVQQYYGYAHGDPELSLCDDDGETTDGDLIANKVLGTFVEMRIE